ncbi:MAG TPA: IclR family transcriptional regulator [Candidatus Dormibacteraeota bacterium]|jgi:DNA-binding IclR family transcriptional regulator|nr:IclR family transcriptional regulator [Candidatus Dormibacteraeota bacterium]
MAVPAKRTYNITSVQRCLRLLSLFAQALDGLSASEVAKKSGLPVSTVHRFLVNLENAGFLTYSSDGKYHLGISSFSIGHAALAQLDIRRLSYPYLQALNQTTRETIHLTVRHGLSAVYVEKLDSPEKLRIFSHIGGSVPLYCTAVGKVMLAYLPQGELEATLRQMDLRPLTANTVSDLPELERNLQRVRKNGYAFDLEEHEAHIRCVAAPIWNPDGVVNASLSLTAPVVRMPLPRLRKLVPLIQEAGLQISRDLGYQGSKRLQNVSDSERPANAIQSSTVRRALEATLR